MIVVFDNGKSYSDHVYAIVEVPENFDADAFVKKAKELHVKFNDYEPTEWWKPVFKAAYPTWYEGDEGPLEFSEFVKDAITPHLGACTKAEWEEEDRELVVEKFLR